MPNRHGIDALIYGFTKNLDYGRRLLADVPQEKMVYQPAPGVNHPAWLFNHLNLYHGVMFHVVRGEAFPDPKPHKFGMTSKPEADAAVYETKEKLLADWIAGHESVIAALGAADPSVLDSAPTLERWATVMPTVQTLLSYLMLVHESTHLGQLSAWRRVQGMPSV